MQRLDHDLAVVHVPIDDLRPDPANPRRISDAELDSLTRSIRQFGFVDPVIAMTRGQIRYRRPPAPARRSQGSDSPRCR